MRVKKLIKKVGKLITASIIVIAIGIVLILLGAPLYIYFKIDTDIIGLIFFTTGTAICCIGIIRRYHLQGWLRFLLGFLAAILFLPLIPLIVSTIYYLITGKPMGG
jgi:hypothetical protein